MEKQKPKSTIVVNFKKLNGKEALELAKKLGKADNDLMNEHEIILAVQADDALEISRFCRVKVFIQDIYSEEENCFLKYFQPNFNVHRNVKGVILNHPEKKLSGHVLETSVNRAKELGMQTLICATSVEEVVEIDKYSPGYICIENEALIGRDISFIEECPEIVQLAKMRTKNKILIGAGIRTSRDLDHVMTTGGAGVIVSSLILKSADPLNALFSLLH